MSSNRPLFIGYWAQDALAKDIGDADVYVPINPVYPEQVDDQYETGWFVSPNEDVKQPHQWVNQWAQNTDYILHSWHIHMSTWLPEVEYVEGAVVHLENKRYIAQRASVGESPLLYPATWEEAAFYTKKQVEADAAKHNADYEAHATDFTNIHQVHVHQLNGYTKEEIDAFVSSPAGSLASHIAKVDNPHNVTYSQLGILPKSGGRHTGVTGVGRMQFRSGQEVRKVGDSLHMLINGHTLGVDDQGAAELNGSLLMDEGNYRQIRHRTAHLFKAPLPDWHLPLANHIHSKISSLGGMNYLSSNEFEYIDKTGTPAVAPVDTPCFTVKGLALSPLSTQYLTIPLEPRDGTIVAAVDGVVKMYRGYMSSQNLLDYFVEYHASAIRDLKVWYTTLTDYQLKSLGVNL